MKMSACTCKPSDKTAEPDLEFYVEDTGVYISLKVRDKTTGLATGNHVIGIEKKTGKLKRYVCINHNFGLPLDSSGRLKLTTEA